MQTIRLIVPTVPEPRILRLVKPLTTIGRSRDNDIVVADAQVKPNHAYFQRSDGDVLVVSVDGEILVGGKKKSKVKLSVGEKIQLGGCTIELFVEPSAANSAPGSGDADVLVALRKLHRFSERLLNHYEPEELWAALVDAVVVITKPCPACCPCGVVKAGGYMTK